MDYVDELNTHLRERMEYFEGLNGHLREKMNEVQRLNNELRERIDFDPENVRLRGSFSTVEK